MRFGARALLSFDALNGVILLRHGVQKNKRTYMTYSVHFLSVSQKSKIKMGLCRSLALSVSAFSSRRSFEDPKCQRTERENDTD